MLGSFGDITPNNKSEINIDQQIENVFDQGKQMKLTEKKIGIFGQDLTKKRRKKRMKKDQEYSFTPEQKKIKPNLNQNQQGVQLKNLQNKDTTALPGPLSSFILIDAKKMIKEKGRESPRQKLIYQQLKRNIQESNNQAQDNFQFRLKLHQSHSDTNYGEISSRPVDSRSDLSNNPEINVSSFPTNKLKSAFADMIKRKSDQFITSKNNSLQNLQSFDYLDNPIAKMMRKKLTLQHDLQNQSTKSQNYNFMPLNTSRSRPINQNTDNVGNQFPTFKPQTKSGDKSKIGEVQQQQSIRQAQKSLQTLKSKKSSIVIDDDLEFSKQYVDFYLNPVNMNRFIMPEKSRKSRQQSSQQSQVKSKIQQSSVQIKRGIQQNQSQNRKSQQSNIYNK